MNKLSPIGAFTFAALVAGLAVLGIFSPAQAYPERTIDVTVSSQTVYSGSSFTATARSEGTVCDWTLSFDTTVRTGTSSTGRPFETSFVAPHVKHDKKVPLRATCRYDDGSNGTQTWHRTIVITVLAPSSAVDAPKSQAGGGPKSQAAAAGPRGSDLPNTGGPTLLILVGGLVLLLAGATAVTVARRRAEEAEIRASRV